MQRVLDIDLDFFVRGVAHRRRREDGRLDPDEYAAWSMQETLDFLQARCGLTGPLPGFVVEHHGDLFPCWRDAIDAGILHAPFHVTHVDAHADLDVGGTGYMHLMSELLFCPPEERRDPGEHLEDGNYLVFAIGCRWLSGLDYVYNRDSDRDGHGPGDLNPMLMENFRMDAEHLQLRAMTKQQLQDHAFGIRGVAPERLEPRVPFRALPWPQYRPPAAFDLICLARSPEYTPGTSDALFDAIRERFIDDLPPTP